MVSGAGAQVNARPARTIVFTPSAETGRHEPDVAVDGPARRRTRRCRDPRSAVNTSATQGAPGVADMTDPIRLRGAGRRIQIRRPPARRGERGRHAARPVAMLNGRHELTSTSRGATVDNCRHMSNTRPACSMHYRRSATNGGPNQSPPQRVDRLLKNQRRGTFHSCA